MKFLKLSGVFQFVISLFFIGYFLYFIFFGFPFVLEPKGRVTAENVFAVNVISLSLVLGLLFSFILFFLDSIGKRIHYILFILGLVWVILSFFGLVFI